jgi:hypothetical protein
MQLVQVVEEQGQRCFLVVHSAQTCMVPYPGDLEWGLQNRAMSIDESAGWGNRAVFEVLSCLYTLDDVLISARMRGRWWSLRRASDLIGIREMLAFLQMHCTYVGVLGTVVLSGHICLAFAYGWHGGLVSLVRTHTGCSAVIHAHLFSFCSPPHRFSLVVPLPPVDLNLE